MSKQNTAAEHGTIVTRLLTDRAGTGTSASEAADCKLRDGVDLEQYIRISADSIGELRKVDVYRVISSVRSGNIDGVTRRDLATYIAAKRHDLVAEVTDVMQEDFPQDDWTADCVAGQKMVPTPDVVHRGWLANLKEGDRVEVPYISSGDDVKLMTVYENDGVWIRLLPDGFSSEIDNTILANAVSGVLHYAPVQIVPPGMTNGKLPGSGGHNSPDHEFKNFHRQLCERFGYSHDDVDWKRDQISLIEWISKRKEELERQRDDLLKAMTVIAAQSEGDDWTVEEAHAFIKQHAREARDAARAEVSANQAT
ncbi:hypothetical protein PQR02_38220 [Paraburkholderia sediminicola]|uniref:Uncharacterized protein n=1 Tax=Paraburkholderia rhynchosiae TaxID=487049 RepID=A0ACC7NV01_9BURK